MKNEGLSKVAEFRDAILAEIAKSKLESEGIRAYLFDENLVRINWLLSQAIGGVKVMVSERDVERAARILAQDNSDLLNGSDAISGADLSMIDTVCTMCGSMDVISITAHRRAALSLLLYFPLLFWRKRYKCRNCGHSWRKKKKKVFHT